MKILILYALVTVFAVSVVFGQAGPKRNEKAKPDTTKTEKKAEKPVKPKDKPEKPTKPKVKPKEKTEKPAKPKDKPKDKPKKPAKPKADPKKDTSEKPAQPKDKPDKEKLEKAQTKAESKVKKAGVRKNEAAGLSKHLKRAQFAAAIEEREPVGSLDSLSNATEQVYFFTEIVGLQGQTITHRWTHDGEVRAEVPISIGGPRWRAHSSKKFLRAWTGEWKVDVVDHEGNLIGSKRLVYYSAKGSQ